MLKIGDTVRYTGVEHNTSSRKHLVGNTFTIVPYEKFTGRKRDVLCLLPLGGGSFLHVFYNDVELAAALEPEEYEAWFV